MTEAEADKEIADFMQYAHDKGWILKRREKDGTLIFGNAAGEESPHQPLAAQFSIAVARGYRPPNKEFLRLAAEEVTKKFPDGWGFILIAAPLGEGGRTTYAANVDRADAIKLLKELMFHWGEDENWMKHIA